MKDSTTITRITAEEMVGLATGEYERLLALLRSLSDEDWDRQTVCDDWTVRLMVAHLLGAAESGASFFESMRQLRKGSRIAKVKKTELIDGINAVQVGARQHLSPAELVEHLESIAPKAVSGRRRTPRPVRRIPIQNGIGGRMTMGDLVDIIYTRDQWLHRIDICLACDRDPILTSDHDARIVADVVREWSAEHGEPFELTLDGPAGGRYRTGENGPNIEMDAVEFCLILSGRLDKEMPLYRPITF